MGWGILLSVTEVDDAALCRRATSPCASLTPPLNYKDGLAITGEGPVVLKGFPMVPAIWPSTVGEATVIPASRSAMRWCSAAGWGVGGALGRAGAARAPQGTVVQDPQQLHAAPGDGNPGTAGYTAMLCVMALERHGAVRSAARCLLVTGANGGVGSVASPAGGWASPWLPTGRPPGGRPPEGARCGRITTAANLAPRARQGALGGRGRHRSAATPWPTPVTSINAVPRHGRGRGPRRGLDSLSRSRPLHPARRRHSPASDCVMAPRERIEAWSCLAARIST